MKPNVVAVSDKSGVDDAFTEDDDDKRLGKSYLDYQRRPPCKYALTVILSIMCSTFNAGVYQDCVNGRWKYGRQVSSHLICAPRVVINSPGSSTD
jgi:hypothetical protein